MQGQINLAATLLTHITSTSPLTAVHDDTSTSSGSPGSLSEGIDGV